MPITIIEALERHPGVLVNRGKARDFSSSLTKLRKLTGDLIPDQSVPATGQAPVKSKEIDLPNAELERFKRHNETISANPAVRKEQLLAMGFEPKSRLHPIQAVKVNPDGDLIDWIGQTTPRKILGISAAAGYIGAVVMLARYFE